MATITFEVDINGDPTEGEVAYAAGFGSATLSNALNEIEGFRVGQVRTEF